MKLKLKIALVLFFGITISFAQITKKITKKPLKAVQNKTIKIAAPTNSNNGIFAEIATTKGNILLQLEFEKAPITVANFVALSEGNHPNVDEKFKGKPFFDGLKFHRVIKDFMIQGGDPAGNGSGNAGYAFKDEFSDLKFVSGGLLAMANSGPATNSSQFFITHKETLWLNDKHTIYGHVVRGMDVVNAIAQDDLINKITITRKGASAKAFDAPKIFGTYYANKADDDKKQAAYRDEKMKKQTEIEATKKKEYTAKYASVMADKVASLAILKTTATKTDSGLEYVIVKGTGAKPVDGTTVLVNYAGFLEDGSLFDSSREDMNKIYGKFDQNRATQNGYQPFPFEIGKKTGLIPGFLEGLNLLSFGDKITLFIPSKLGYGSNGAGNVIPPNANLIFELEILEKK